MQSRIRLLGHPIHPILVAFPLALFSVAVLFDAVYLVTGFETLADVAYWNITIGIVGGLVAAVFGFVDWAAIPKRTRARSVGAWHGVGNAFVIALLLISWYLRLQDYSYAPDITPFVVAVIGVSIALVTAWLGGELVYRLRVAVDENAGLNAPSSISAGLISTTDEPPGTAGGSGR
jgi:uncharacterized membrane protein